MENSYESLTCVTTHQFLYRDILGSRCAPLFALCNVFITSVFLTVVHCIGMASMECYLPTTGAVPSDQK
jgi:hypothetical protein